MRNDEYILSAWLFALGGVIGSFLNVVIYRLPAGLSLVKPGSHCPMCKRPIRWYDNVPILGWFLLGGRCRDCKARISFRYPLVEAITAAMFLAVGMADGLSAGAGLPLDGKAAMLTAYHLLLLCTLLAAGLIQYDGHRVPWQLMLPALVIGVLAPLVWPQVRPALTLGTWAGLAKMGWPGWVIGLVDGATGMAVGGAAGLFAWYMLGAPRRWPQAPRTLSELTLGAACVGLFLGWQAAVLLGILSLGLYGTAVLAGRKWPLLPRLFPDLFLIAAAIAWILAWNDLVRLAVR